MTSKVAQEDHGARRGRIGGARSTGWLVVVALSTGLVTATSVRAQEADDSQVTRSPSEVVAAAGGDEWRALDPENTVYLELPDGRVVVELAPRFAPRHVENIRAMVRAGFFDGGGVVRSQDNYVAQWGTRPFEEGASVPDLLATPLPAEFDVPIEDELFISLPDPDPYADEVGFVEGFPAARDSGGPTWMAHCYGVVGVGRDNSPDSGNGSSLYAVTGHAPRHLDRNLSMVGRVVVGMELLTTLPRGTGPLGFYETDEEIVPIRSATLGADMPASERASLELLRTDSPSFREYVMARRARSGEWFVYAAHGIDVCNVPVPTRPIEP